MAPTIKWQRWDSSSYNWFGQTASDALPALEAELDAWITTVNGNASNTGRQITKERGYADSTGGNYAGLTISAGANNNTAKGYFFFGCYNQTTTRRYQLGDTFTDDTSNGGYGTISGGYTDTSVSWIPSGQEANWLVISGTVDGQEYFIFGSTFNNKTESTYQDGFAIFKCTDGEWSITSQDGTANVGHIHYWDDVTGTGFDNCVRDGGANLDKALTFDTYMYNRYCIVANTTSGSSSADPTTDGNRVVYAASPDMYSIAPSATYAYTGTRRVMSGLGSGDNVYMLSSYYYGPCFLVDLRP